MTAAPPPGPEITVAPVVSASAGVPVALEVHIWHPGPRPATVMVAVRGLDAEWTPPPVDLGTLAPGESRTVSFELRPGPSSLGARYPFVVMAAASDPLGRGDRHTASAESTLVIGGREPTVLDLDPPQITAVFGRRVRLTITNPSLIDRELVVDPTVPAGLSAQFDPGPIGVAAGRTVTVRGKVKVRRPRVFGSVQTHSYAVAARGQGAPVVVTGTVRARPVFRGALVRSLVLVAVVALWAGLAVVAIPRVSSYFTTQTQDNQAGGAAPDQPAGTGSAQAPSGGGDGSGGDSVGSGGDGAAPGAGDQGGTDQGGTEGGTDQAGADQGGDGGGPGDSGDGTGAAGDAEDATDTGDTGGGQGGAGDTPAAEPGGGETGGETGGQSGGESEGDAEQQAPGATPDQVALRGLITGPDPGGVTVVLSPTGLTEAAEQGAEPAPGTDEQTASGLRALRGVIGKVPASALRAATADEPPTITTTTNDDGTWAIAGVRPQGFYLLTLARAGYQTQRFVVNGANLIGADPMRIALVAGGGAMSGTVTGPDGPVGAATVTITDGHVSVQTSSISPGTEGTPGSWSVTGLSTPGTYLVSAAAQGFSTSSTLVTLGAGGTATADLTLQTGAAAVTGLVSGEDLLGRLGGLGGLSVAITGRSGDVTTTRNATTVTSGPVGTYALPDLPTPGDYTLTVSGAGYSDQVRQVSLAEGVGSVEVNVSMVRADGVVSGTVFGNPANGDQPAEGGLIGAGLTLTGPAGSTKTMTTSDPPGSFRFTGVAPGVYVLSASMFGRIASSVTVEVAAAGQATADLTLLSSADTELPATSHIQGRVTDSRTGGDITCDRAIDPTVPCIITASVSVPAIDPNTGRIDPDAPPQTVTSQALPGENYVLPAPDDPDHPGLVPGLYTVTITAPGYEPGEVSVQVPQGATMSAEPVSLVPLSLIAGRLTTRVGTPTDPTCVAVVPAGVNPPVQSAGCVGALDGKTCVVGGDPSIRCGLVQDDSTYQVRGLVSGGYTVVVLPSDTEYIPPPPFNLTIERGSDGRYDPVLDRLGRISVTVRQPNPDTGELSLTAGATVVAKTGTTVAAQATSGADGIALLTTLREPSYQVVASGAAGTATADNIPVQLNQTYDLDVTLLKPLGTIVGRVLTSDGITTGGVGVPDARVTVTGIVGYTGTTPILGSATMNSDSTGCFAIVPTQGPDPVVGLPNLCPTVPNAASGVAVPGPYFVARPVSVQVDPTNLSQAALTAQIGIAGTGEVLSVPAEATTVLPKPSATTDLTLQTVPGALTRGQAAISVLSKPPGSGQVSVVDGNNGTGALQWTDTAVTGTNLLSPGRYAVAATLPGFTPSPAAAQVLCPLGQACLYVTGANSTVPDPNGFQLIRNPLFAGTLSVQPANASISGVAFSVTTLNGTPPVTMSQSNGVLTWQEAGAPVNRVSPGSYSIAATLSGFVSDPVSFTCAAPATGLETCAPPTISLRQLSTQILTIRSSFAGFNPETPTGATVLISGNAVGAIGPLATQDNGDGTVGVTVPPVPPSSATNAYTVTVKAPGFATTDFTTSSALSCAPAGNLFQPGTSRCTLPIAQLGQFNVTTRQVTGTGPATTLPSVTVTATLLTALTPPTTDADRVPWTVVTGANGAAQITGTLSRPGLTFGTYQIRATRAGYDEKVVEVTIGPGQPTLPVQLDLNLKPVTVDLSLIDNGTTVLPAGTIRLSGGSVNLSCLIASDDATNCTPPQNGISISNRVISFANLPPAVYTVSFVPSGTIYQQASMAFQLFPADAPQAVQLNLARRSSNQTGAVTGPDSRPLVGAQVSLRQSADVTQVAKDVRGVDVPIDITDDAGTFAFADLPDGSYRVMVDACGFDRVIGAPIAVNASVVPRPALLQVTGRTVRAVTVTVTSTAGANLNGAPASFQPATGGGTPSCTPPASTALTGLTVTDGKVSTTQLPTGNWSLVVTPATSQFGAVTTDPFLADQPPRGAPAVPPTPPPAETITLDRDVRQAAMTMTATWPDECSPPPTAVSLTLTRDGVDGPPLPATITPGTGNAGRATVTALLPVGSYSWSVAAADGYTAAPGPRTFDVPSTGATTPVLIDVTLLSPGVGVSPTVTVDDNPQTGIPMTAARAGVTVPPDGAGEFCLPPGGDGWTFSVRSAGSTMLIPDVENVVVSRAGPNTVTFTGFTLQPGVTLATVDRRPADTTTRQVTLTLSLAGATVWSGPASVPGGATTGTGSLLTLGSGIYTLAADGSPPFGAADIDDVDPEETHTASVTMPYEAVTLAVTASNAGTPSAGATITLTPAAGGSPRPTLSTGPAIFADIDPGTYTITATQTIGGTEFRGELTGQVLAEGTSPLLDVPMTAVPAPGG